jgi:hypothetical protein
MEEKTLIQLGEEVDKFDAEGSVPPFEGKIAKKFA